MLDSIVAFLYKDTKLKTRKVLSNTKKLFDMIDDSIYENNEPAKARIWVIRKTLEAKLTHGFENEEVIKTYCKEHSESTELTNFIVDSIGKTKLSYDEVRYLIKCIDDRVEYGYTITLKEIYQEIINQIDDGDFKSYKAVSEDLYDIATATINIKRNTNSLDSDGTFSLREDYFEDVITDAVNKLRDKNRVFMTGIRRLNTILSPGYHSKRLYMYLAFPGGGKSQILLKTALDIKKYNADIETKDPEKIPTVLMITMENDIDETIERMFNMTVSADDIRNYTPKQVIKKLKKDGDICLTDKNPIDIIIKYCPNRSIDTDDLYGIINDLNDDGHEVIALILDYVKRIRPAEKALSEKEELKNITNELKTLAKKFDIPVITAQQLNRVASTVVDSALQNKKEDVTRLIGRDGVANSWEIIENSDWVCIINQEVKMDTGDVYLTFKMLKRRYRSSEDDEKLKRLDYFNHPYEKENTIKLIDDIDLPDTVSLYSLSSTFMSLEEAKKEKKPMFVKRVERENKDDNDEFKDVAEYEPFDENRVEN